MKITDERVNMYTHEDTGRERAVIMIECEDHSRPGAMRAAAQRAREFAGEIEVMADSLEQHAEGGDVLRAASRGDDSASGDLCDAAP